MRKIAAVIIFVVLFSITASAFAADWQLNFQMSVENDGSFSGEMWYNNDMLWRLKIQADGAIPATSGKDPKTTVLVPDIVNGLFVLKVHR